MRSLRSNTAVPVAVPLPLVPEESVASALFRPVGQPGLGRRLRDRVLALFRLLWVAVGGVQSTEKGGTKHFSVPSGRLRVPLGGGGALGREMAASPPRAFSGGGRKIGGNVMTEVRTFLDLPWQWRWEYMDAAFTHGPGSSQAKAVRRKYSGDSLFGEFADATDSMKRAVAETAVAFQPEEEPDAVGVG